MFSANASQVSNDVKYIEDFCSVYLRTGTGASQTVTTGVKENTGALVISKSRSAATDWAWYDTFRGATYDLVSNSTAAQTTQSQGLTAFNADGHTWGTLAKINTSGATYVDTVLKPTPKFFDVVTWTGDDSANRQISHSLGSVPGCIIVKRTDASATWRVWHQNMVSNSANLYLNQLNLNTTDAVNLTYGEVWGTSNNVTSTTFQVGSLAAVNGSGGTYVAYLFAHDAGGFGLTGTDNVISCGSYTGNGSATGPVITLGYEPQWVMIKKTSDIGNWHMHDIMRDMSVTSNSLLWANLSDAEVAGASAKIAPLATGFQITNSTNGENESGGTFIYIAIRRGPMKVPTSGTSVFQAITDTGGLIDTSTATFPLDMQYNTLYSQSNATYNNQINDRLRGIGFAPSFTTTPHLTTASTAAETTSSSYLAFKGNGMDVTKDTGWGGTSAVFYNFRRAPSFFDEVCYTGTGSNITLNHNLGAVPELMIFKTRTGAARAWGVYSSAFGVNKKLLLNTTAAVANDSFFVDTTPTATVFYPGNADESNEGGNTYVAYLFASCPGVSKVTSFTGNGSSQTINCGFTGGARFVLIKRTDSTGNWVTFDTARGISSGGDPALYLNSTAAEVTGVDAIDTDSTGFIVNQESTFNLNVSSATYLVLAIA